MEFRKDWLEQNLFSEVSREHFFAEIQGKSWFSSQITSEAFSQLPSWEDINLFLSYHRLSHPRVRMSREGATDEELTILRQRFTLRNEPIFDTLQNRLYDNLRLGSTLVLDALDIAIPEVREIASSIASTFCVKPQANGYITFSESRGFGLHWDDHDVLIVQVHGKKTWHLYGNTREAPMHRDYHDNHPVPSEIVETIVLNPGSLLYVPRGCWHDVVGHGEPTFHITFGFTPPTGIDFFIWMQEALRKNNFFRRDVPIYQSSELDSYAKQLKEELLNFLGRDVMSSFVRDLKGSLPSYPNFSLPLGIDENNIPSPSEVISLAHSAPHFFEENDFLIIEANNLKWTLPKISLNLLLKLMDTDVLVMDSWKICCEKSEYTLDEWSRFLNNLVAQGLITVKSPK